MQFRQSRWGRQRQIAKDQSLGTVALAVPYYKRSSHPETLRQGVAGGGRGERLASRLWEPSPTRPTHLLELICTEGAA